MQWDAYFSQCGASVGQPSLRAIVNRFSGVPGAIGLHAGLPAAEAFPITSMHCTLRDGTQVTIDNPETVRLPVSGALNAYICCSIVSGRSTLTGTTEACFGNIHAVQCSQQEHPALQSVHQLDKTPCPALCCSWLPCSSTASRRWATPRWQSGPRSTPSANTTRQ